MSIIMYPRKFEEEILKKKNNLNHSNQRIFSELALPLLFFLDQRRQRFSQFVQVSRRIASPSFHWNFKLFFFDLGFYYTICIFNSTKIDLFRYGLNLTILVYHKN